MISTSRRRRAIFATFAFVLAATVPVFIGPSALAEDGPFTVNAVVPDAGATELSDPPGSLKKLGPKSSNTTNDNRRGDG